MADSDAQTRLPAPSKCQGCSGKHKAPSMKTLLPPRHPHKALHALVCESLESMTNVQWKFRSVPLDYICICPLWSMRTSHCTVRCGGAAQTQISSIQQVYLRLEEGGRARLGQGVCSGSRSALLLVKCFQNVSASKNKRSLVHCVNPTGAFLAEGGNYCRFQSCDGSSRTGLQRSLVRLTDGRWRRALTDRLVCPKNVGEGKRREWRGLCS